MHAGVADYGFSRVCHFWLKFSFYSIIYLAYHQPVIFCWLDADEVRIRFVSTAAAALALSIGLVACGPNSSSSTITAKPTTQAVSGSSSHAPSAKPTVASTFDSANPPGNSDGNPQPTITAVPSTNSATSSGAGIDVCSAISGANVSRILRASFEVSSLTKGAKSPTPRTGTCMYYDSSTDQMITIMYLPVAVWAGQVDLMNQGNHAHYLPGFNNTALVSDENYFLRVGSDRVVWVMGPLTGNQFTSARLIALMQFSADNLKNLK